MCGIAGHFFSDERQVSAESGALALAALRHRGPDAEGMYMDPRGRGLLVHTRLAILDLSAAGAQPMTRGRVVISFNGEIYNFKELKEELEAAGEVFVSHGDTEVMLALYLREGAGFVKRLRGMFAFALWDEAAGKVLLGRDPLGIKPLYVCERDGELGVASELRALVKASFCGRELDEEGVWSFFRYGSVAEPRTMIDGVRMLPAGHVMEWAEGRSELRCYWEPNIPQGDEVDAVGRTRRALEDTMRAHLVSDVPVGVFLSGGMDSTTLALLARREGLRTFAIGFEEMKYDESAVAERTARALGTQHTTKVMTATEGRAWMRDFVGSLDQPTIDGFNTYCVSRVASEAGCKVVLSGVGGDEVFGGYASFQRIPQLVRWHRRLGWLPGACGLGAALLGLVKRTPVGRRVAEFLRSDGSVMAAWEACRVMYTKEEALALTGHFCGASDGGGEVGRGWMGRTEGDAVSLLEISRYMRNQLLRDSDVLSMRWGLELRTPLVDHVLYESLFAIAARRRLRLGKELLAEAMPELPEWVVGQKKRGFAFPFEEWFAAEWEGELRGGSEGLPVAAVTWYQQWACFVFNQWRAEVLGA